MTIDLDALEEMARNIAVTPGPWFAVNVGAPAEPMMMVKAARIAGKPPQHEVAIVATGDSPQEMEEANARFIAACDPQTILGMIAEIKSLRGGR